MNTEINIGKKYHMLTCISSTENIIYRNKQTVTAIFICDCGKERRYSVKSVKSGGTKSCGCFTKSNIGTSPKKHQLMQSYKAMRNRCYNKNFKSYIGNGITVCESWLNDYMVFYNWAIDKWSEDKKLSRLDKNGNFCPENCYFKNKSEIGIENSAGSHEKSKGTSLSKYGVEHYNMLESSKEKARATNLAKYGVETVSQVEEFKNKTIDTCMKKYGVSNFTKTKEYKEISKKTSLEKYGTEFPQSSEFVKNKIKETFLNKYGVDNIFSLPETKEKSKKTNLEKYGTEHPVKNKTIFNKICDTKQEKYGNPFFGQTNGNSENEVRKWFETLTSKDFKSDRTILGTKELDMYNPELKVAVEFCGIYWHSEHKSGTRQSHNYKYQECLKQGIRLFTIFSDEWTNRNQQVKSFLKASLGIHKEKYFARKCEVKQIDKKIGRNFIETYHIQGQKRTATIYFGLFHENELLGVMSLAKHHRNNKDIVLDRLAFKEDVLVVGGASKLLSRAKEWLISNNYSKITSWSDNRWSIGSIYEKLGFIKSEELSPDYSYVNKNDKNNRLSKQNARKCKINCKPNQTEYERMKELGYARIWDCGKIRWELSLAPATTT